MLRPALFRRTVCSLFVAFFGVICPACSFETGGDDQSVEDTSSAEEDSKGFDLPDQPLPKMTCDPLLGNVPLTICCKLELGLDPSTEAKDYFIDLDWKDGTSKTAVDPAALDNVCHEFTYKGAFKPTLSVKWKKNLQVAGEANVAIEADQPASLSVSNVALHSTELVGTGDEIKLSFILGNEGDGVEKAFKTGVFLSVDDKVDDADFMIHEITHKDGIGSGLAEPVEMIWTEEKPVVITLASKDLNGKEIKDGSYFIIVKIDHEDTVGDLNKLDNARYAGSLLQIDNAVYLKSDVTVTPPEVDTTTSYSPGDSAQYKVLVENKGPGEAKNFKLAVYLSKDKVINHKKDIPDEEVDISQSDLLITDPATATFTTLKAGSKLPIQRGFAVPEIPDGEYYLIAKIDAEEALAEENEDNNIAVSAGTVAVKKVIKKGIDVALLDMFVKPKGTYLEGTVSVNYRVKNIGTLPSPKLEAIIYFCKGALSKNQCLVNKTPFSLPALAVGQELKSLQIVKINKSTPVGEYNVYLLLDPDSKVAELDEGNNIKKYPPKNEQPLTITATKSVDLTVKSIGFHPAKLKAGDDLKLGYKVINGGTSGTGAFKVHIVASEDKSITKASIQQGKDFVIHSVIDEGIGSLGVEFRNHKLVVPPGLSHKVKDWYLGVFVDAEDDISGETDENNNVGSSTTTLIVNDTKGGCYEDKYDKDAKTNNNTSKTPTALQTGKTSGLGSCGNEDWYSLEVKKGHSVFVTLESQSILWTSPVSSDVNIDIVSPAGKVLSSVKGLGNLKKATALTVTKAGKYLLRVYPHTSTVQAQYSLDVKIEAPPSGIDLFAGSLTAGPTGVFLGALLKTKLLLTNLGNNPSGKFTIDYRLSMDPKWDAKDIKLTSHVMTKGLGGAEGATLNKNILLPDNIKGGKYYVVTKLDSSEAINEKDEKNNTISSNSVVVNAAKKCASDTYAGNHTAEDAQKLEPKSQELKGLNVCPGLEDWFYIDMPQGKALTIELLWKHETPKGIVGVQFVDSTAKGIIAGAANPFNSVAKIPYLQVGGRYYIHTYVLPEFGGTPEPRDYGLKITIAEPDPSDVCLPDVYESNNASESAKEVGCGLANLTLCLGDEDWFYLDMAKDEQIKFIFTQAGSSFQFHIYDNPKLKPLSSQSGSGDVVFKAPKQGKYYMHVTYAQGAGKPSSFAYKLKVDGGKGVDIIPEILSIYPTKAAGDESISLKTSISNECKTPATTFHVGYYLSEDNILDSGDIVLRQRQVSGLKGKQKLELLDAVIIPFNAKVAKSNIIVKADSFEKVTESQELNNIAYTALDVVEGCKPDSFEFDNFISDAKKNKKPVTQRRIENLTVCPFDKDVWEFQVKKGETLSVSVEFKHSDGDLNLFLFNESGKLIQDSATQADLETVTVTAMADMTVFARVRAATNDAWNRYSLLTCKAVGSKCIECTDKSQCSGDNICKDTKCQPLGCKIGENKTCNDGNSCTAGECVADYGCKFEKLVGVECEDGDLCTMGHTCDVNGSCVASLVAAVTETTWQGQGISGDMVSLPSTAERLYIGSWIDPQDGKLKGRGEMVGIGGGYAHWNEAYWHKGVAAAHLASAVTRTGKDELLAVGWVEMSAGATATLAGAATETAGWVVQIAGDNGAMMGSVLVGDGKAKRVGLRRIIEIADGQHAAVGWATAGSAKDGVDAFAVILDNAGKTVQELPWGGTGNDAYYDAVVTPGGGFVAAGVNRDDKGKAVGVLVGYDAKHKKLWESPLALGTFQTTLWSVRRSATGGLVCGGGADVGQAGGSPPNYKGWVVWMAPGKATDAPLMQANLVLDPATPQDKDYKGVKVAMVRALNIQPDGSILAAGSIGARASAKGLLDGAIWHIGADRKLKKARSWGGANDEHFEAVTSWQGQLRAFGSSDAGNTSSTWYEVRDTPLKAECNDANVCTVDACDATKGCHFKPVKDGTSCGTGRHCQTGQCVVK